MPDLYPHQVEGVKFLTSKQRSLLLDEPGCGKTIQSVVAFNNIGAKNVVIFCPPAVRYHWENEVKAWSKHDYQVHVLTKQMEKIIVTNRPLVVICSYSLVHSPMIADQLKGRKWGCCIIDEIHMLKETKSKRQKIILGRGGVVSKSVYAIGLTGTPMINAPYEMWPVFRSMGREHLPEKANDYQGYHRTFCNMRKTRFGWDIKGAKNLDVLNKCLYDSGFALRRKLVDVMPDMPPRTYRVTPMDGDTRTEIKWEEKLKLEINSPGMDAGELAEARKELVDAKLPAILDFFNTIDEPTILFCWHRHVVEHLRDTLKAIPYYGGMSPSQKEEAKARFIAGEKQFMAVNIASGGTGLDGLQKRANRCVFVELPWTTAEIDQAVGRLDRIGQTKPVLADLLVLKGGVEEYIAKVLLRKQRNFQKVVDARAHSIL